MPCSASSAASCASISTAGAYDSGDGSKPGIVRWNSSWYARRVARRELEHAPGRDLAAPRAGRCVAEVAGHGLERSLPALGEHRVVDRVLRGEVLVERRRPHPHPRREVAQRQRGQAVLAHQVPGRVEDLGLGRLAAAVPAGLPGRRRRFALRFS